MQYSCYDYPLSLPRLEQHGIWNSLCLFTFNEVVFTVHGRSVQNVLTLSLNNSFWVFIRVLLVWYILFLKSSGVLVILTRFIDVLLGLIWLGIECAKGGFNGSELDFIGRISETAFLITSGVFTSFVRVSYKKGRHFIVTNILKIKFQTLPAMENSD